MRIIAIATVGLCLFCGCAYWQHTYEKVVYEAVYNEDGSRATDEDGKPLWREIRKYTYDSYHGGDTHYKTKYFKKYNDDGDVIEELEEDEFDRGISAPILGAATAAQGAVETLTEGL